MLRILGRSLVLGDFEADDLQIPTISKILGLDLCPLNFAIVSGLNPISFALFRNLYAKDGSLRP